MAESAYYVAYLMTNNYDLLNRVAASAQQEIERLGLTDIDPYEWSVTHKWEWATQDDWTAAVLAAITTGITEWGRNPNVVTDQMILSWVQPAIAPAP
jgi:hypothetical protein